MQVPLLDEALIACGTLKAFFFFSKQCLILKCSSTKRNSKIMHDHSQFKNTVLLFSNIFLPGSHSLPQSFHITLGHSRIEPSELQKFFLFFFSPQKKASNCYVWMENLSPARVGRGRGRGCGQVDKHHLQLSPHSAHPLAHCQSVGEWGVCMLSELF